VPGAHDVPDQAGAYAPGEVVTLTATPSAGSVFTGWTGHITTTNNPAALSMNSDKTIAAGFGTSLAAPTAYQPQTLPSLQADGFRLLLSGPTNSSYAIEHSTDFTSWISFQSNLVVATPFEIRDQTVSNALFRFYRIRRLP